MWQETAKPQETSMRRLFTALAIVVPAYVSAQTAHQHPMATADMPPAHLSGAGMNQPTQPGQGAFAAIQEIVGILEGDPKTDWSKVNIDALRQHLIDMNNVTLAADVKTDAIENGLRFTVTGAGPIASSIRRMVTAHANTMNGVGSWTFQAAEFENGATLTVLVPPKDVRKLRGLGFVGVMTHGLHHQHHHLMIARGGLSR
jgi:hypothetical protein